GARFDLGRAFDVARGDERIHCEAGQGRVAVQVRDGAFEGGQLQVHAPGVGAGAYAQRRIARLGEIEVRLAQIEIGVHGRLVERLPDTLDAHRREVQEHARAHVAHAPIVLHWRADAKIEWREVA